MLSDAEAVAAARRNAVDYSSGGLLGLLHHADSLYAPVLAAVLDVAPHHNSRRRNAVDFTALQALLGEAGLCLPPLAVEEEEGAAWCAGPLAKFGPSINIEPAAEAEAEAQEEQPQAATLAAVMGALQLLEPQPHPRSSYDSVQSMSQASTPLTPLEDMAADPQAGADSNANFFREDLDQDDAPMAGPRGRRNAVDYSVWNQVPLELQQVLLNLRA